MVLSRSASSRMARRCSVTSISTDSDRMTPPVAVPLGGGGEEDVDQ